MKRLLAVIVAASLALGPDAGPVAAAPAEGAVTSLSVVPSSGRAELVIGVNGGVDVADFTLKSPDRIVLEELADRLARFVEPLEPSVYARYRRWRKDDA